MFNNPKYKIIQPLLFAVILALGLQLGMLLNKVKTPTPVSLVDNFRRNNKVDNVIDFIENRYLDTVNRDEMYETAIKAVFDELDPFSYYIAPQRYNQITESLEGKFEGIGIEFFIVKDTIMVVSPISGGPSEELGILSGDKIIYIDTQLVAGVSVSNKDVVSKLRGKKGTKVDVKILRNGIPHLLPFTIKRDHIPLYSIDVGYMIDTTTGYIKINRFSAETATEFSSKLKMLTDQGMQNLILDLRQNPGGYLKAAIEVSDEFLDQNKLIVYTQGKTAHKKEYRATKEGLFEKGKVIVLVNEGSASASEIVSGALQDWDRATIVGRRTFGKGLVQEQFGLTDGAAMRLTVAKYYTPTGRCIQKPLENNALGLDSSVTDSALVYTTPAGKKVYGGGGIYPDEVIPLDTTQMNPYLLQVIIHGVIPRFSYDYYSSHTEEFKQFENFGKFKENYTIEEDVFTSFINLAEELGIEKDIENIQQVEQIIKQRLKAYLAKQVWKQDGFYPLLNDLDRDFQFAYTLIQQSKSTQDTDTAQTAGIQ